MNKTSIYKSEAGEREIIALYDYVLARWPVPYESLNIPTRQGNTHIIASGEPGLPPLILIHGSCSNAVSWGGDIAEYSRHFRVYAIDILGEAGKSAPVRPAWAGAAFAEWLEDVLNGLKIEKASFLGISLGGWMAVKFASYRPERVEKLVLLAPGGIAQPRASFLFNSILFSMFGKAGAGAINRMVFGNKPVDEGAFRFFNVIMTGFRPRFDRQPLFNDEELGRLTMPVLLIAGEKDALLPSAKTIERMKRLVPQTDARMLPGEGHALLGMASSTLPFLL
jgi:pimeloyl-ACP methyl ester carboxylesterase